MTNDQNLTTFLDLCDPFRQAISDVPSEESWHSISELSKLHGVTPFLYYRARSLGIRLPDEIEKEWLGIYLYQIAQEQKARQQIKELKDILAPEGIPMVLLKGASAVLRLYPQPGLRTFCDLDILIPTDKVSVFKRIMRMKGYKPVGMLTSPEDERLQQFDCHLDPLWKEDALIIEAHVSILGGKGNYLVALPEIWQDKEEININGIVIDHLSKEHFLIHMLLHWINDFSYNGFAQTKGFIDALYALKTWRIDWSKFRDTARRWDVGREILPLIATMNHYWQAGIPLADEVRPLNLQTLVLGVENQKKHYHSRIPADYIKRLLLTRDLPDTPSRIRYVLHLLFPSQENLRRRFNLPSTRSTVPYYLPYILLICRRFFLGLWYRILYRAEDDIS
jgi:hypothetical protein